MILPLSLFMEEKDDLKLEIFPASNSGPEVNIPCVNGTVPAGFPSPAADYEEHAIDLNKELIRHPSTTFFVRVSGDSMIDEHIEEGDLLVVDKGVDAYDGCLAVCYIDGEFTLKRVRFEDSGVWLVPANPKYKRIKVEEDNQLIIWGVVTYSIKKHL